SRGRGRILPPAFPFFRGAGAGRAAAGFCFGCRPRPRRGEYRKEMSRAIRAAPPLREGRAVMANSFGSRSALQVGGRTYTIHRLAAVEKAIPEAARLPYSLKILLENLLRTENGLAVRPDDIEALARWQPK